MLALYDEDLKNYRRRRSAVGGAGEKASNGQEAKVKQMEGRGRPVYSISAVARMLGVPVATIRTWEDRYNLVIPERNASGHRLYSRDQIEQLRFVRTSMAEGATAADAHRLLAERMDSGSPVPSYDAPGGRLLVLLAENDPYAAELQEFFLRSEGFEVEVALDEERARQSFIKSSPSLVVVELLISGGAGLELCRAFRERGRLPIVAVSALEFQDLAISAGADAFLMKPMDPLRLVSTVKDLLGTRPFMPSGTGTAS
jgi:DNA-binding transcriptional MerR regulator